jgi:uroporphyrinogen decarboxylase
LRERARALHEGTDFAIVLTLGIGPVHISQFLRGWTEYMEDLVERPAFAEALMDHVVDFWVAVTERALAEAGEFVDIVVFLDDVGGQRAPLMKPEMYRRMIKPRHRRLVDSGKRHGKRVLWHTCGSVYALIPDLIDIGIDALNPVQVSAAHMDPKRLKREFGRDLAFWGGIDTHRVLPFGTPADVCDEVKRLIEDLASGGGYVLGAVHNIQPDVPPENILALYAAPRNPDAPRKKTGDSPRVSGFSVQEDRP